MTALNLAAYPEIRAAIQFGSSISGDTYEGSDVDLMVIGKGNSKKAKEKINETLRKELDYSYQTHVYTQQEFVRAVEGREPLLLSAIHTGRILQGNEFIQPLKKYKPTKYTVKRCMLTSFAALGMGISDLLQGLMYDDAVNSLYHAARSSIWATLMEKEITPPNKRVLELLKDAEMKTHYERIITFRSNIPDCGHELDLEKRIWEHGDVDTFTDLLRMVNSIVKTNYQKIFHRNFVDCFEVFSILRKRYEQPKYSVGQKQLNNNYPALYMKDITSTINYLCPSVYYSLMLSVDWKKNRPSYLVMLHQEKEWISLVIDAHDGKIQEEKRHEDNSKHE